MTADMEALVEKLEKATGPDRELDVDICMVISDYSQGEYRRWCGLHPKGSKTPSVRDFLCAKLSTRYTGSMDAALIPSRGLSWAAGDCNENDQPWACLTDRNGTDYAAIGATPIIALCISALRARSASRGTV